MSSPVTVRSKEPMIPMFRFVPTIRGPFSLVLATASLFAVLSGCAQENPQADADRLRLKTLGMLCGQYVARHQGQLPSDEATLRRFADESAASLQSQAGVSTLDELFRTQDGQNFVVLYGMSNPPSDIVAHSPAGADGRRWVVDSLGVVSEWDAQQWQAKMGSRP